MKIINKLLKVFTKSNIGALAIINLFLAFTAFFKDVFFAAYMGTSQHADAFVIAFFVPDMIGNNVIAATIGVTTVPVFASILSEYRHKHLAKLLKNTVISTVSIMLVFLVFLYIFIPQMVSLLGPGLDINTKKTAASLLVILLPTIVIFPLITIGSSLHHSLNSFKIPALGPLFFNTIFLMGTILMLFSNVTLETGVFYIAFFVVAGVSSMFFVVWPSICLNKRISLHLFSGPLFSRDKLILSGMHKILKSFFPYLTILLLTQLTLYIEKYLASSLEPGSIAALNYAFRLSQFPIWVFIAALGTVYLPQMSKSLAKNNQIELRDIIKKSIVQCVLLTLPIASAFFLLRGPIISILFMRGAFGVSSAEKTAHVLEGYSIAIMGQAIMFICLRIFLALQNTRIPLLSFSLGFIINLSINLLFINKLGLRALGYAAAVGSISTSVILLCYLAKKYCFKFKTILSMFVKTILSTVPMAIVFAFGNYLLKDTNINLIIKTGYLIIILMIGLLLYAVILKCCNMLKNAI